MENGSTPARQRSRHRWVPWLVLALLAGIVAGVWALGGFKGGAERTIEEVDRPFDIGPATVTVHDATATPTYGGGWRVTVNATCVVTADNGPHIALEEDLALFATVTKPLVMSERHLVRFDPPEGFGFERDYLGPGLAPMRCAFVGQMPGSYDPSTGLQVSIRQMEFSDASVTGDAERWHTTTASHLVTIPTVRVVKEP